MIVVADTSPVNYLVLLKHIEILPKIYGEVLIPQAVYDELQDCEAPAEIRAWLSTPPAWLRISNVSYQPDPLLALLDRGEQDAILLAKSVKAERLIIDDLDGRREAANRNLPVIGTLGVLAEAARRNFLDLSQALALYRQLTFMRHPNSYSYC